MRTLVKILVGLFIIWLIFNLKKNYKRVCGKYHYLKRKYSRNYYIFTRKYFTQINDGKRILLFLAEVTALIVLTLFIFEATEIIKYDEEVKRLYMTFSVVNEKIKDQSYGYLWAQISASLIVSTVVSLLSVFSETYVYGKKQINVIYNNKSLFSLGKMYICLMALNFGSLIICVISTHYYMILVNFIIMLCIVSYMLFRIVFFYTHVDFYKSCVKSDYIKRERRHIKKAMPMTPYTDVEIEKLKIRTLELIQKNDNNYNLNVNVLMDMVEISLMNNSKRTQEYYTEMILERTDFISCVLEIITHLIKFNKETEACNLMTILTSRLVYYRIVLIQDHFSFSIILDLINAGKYIENERIAIEHYRKLWRIIENDIFLVYLYNCELDFSYCRLGKDDHIYYITHSDYLDKIYLSIRENSKLNDVEKNRIYNQLYDNIRMMELKEKHPNRDIRHLWNDELNKDTISIPLIIKGEPLVLMFARMFEEQDIENLKLFKTMNLSDLLMKYITCVITASLIRFLHEECKREFLYDISLSEEEIINTYTTVKFHSQKSFSEDELKELYVLLKEEYAMETPERPYMRYPNIRTTMDSLNNYFHILFNKIGKEEVFIELVEDDFVENKKIVEIIKKLEI